MPVSSFVSPFTTTSREEIFQWPSGASLVVGAAGIDSTTPSNSVERSPEPGGATMGALTIETATRYEGREGARRRVVDSRDDVDDVADPGFADDLRVGIHLHRSVRDRPRRRRDRLHGAPEREELRRRDAVSADARREKAAGIQDGDDREHARLQVVDSLDGAVRTGDGPLRTRVRGDRAEEHREGSARERPPTGSCPRARPRASGKRRRSWPEEAEAGKPQWRVRHRHLRDDPGADENAGPRERIGEAIVGARDRGIRDVDLNSAFDEVEDRTGDFRDGSLDGGRSHGQRKRWSVRRGREGRKAGEEKESHDDERRKS